MSKFFYMRVLVLLVALFGVFYVIHSMSPEKVQASLDNVGLNPQPGPPASRSSSDQIELCRTRVRAIVWPDGRKIQQDPSGMKARWQAYNLSPEDIGPMEIEKWLSLHCATSATVVSSAQAPTSELLRFDYIDGTQAELFHGEGDRYGFSGKTFDSPELTQALNDLIHIANLEPRGP